MLKPTYVLAACIGIGIAISMGVLINQTFIQV